MGAITEKAKLRQQKNVNRRQEDKGLQQEIQPLMRERYFTKRKASTIMGYLKISSQKYAGKCMQVTKRHVHQLLMVLDYYALHRDEPSQVCEVIVTNCLIDTPSSLCDSLWKVSPY